MVLMPFQLYRGDGVVYSIMKTIKKKQVCGFLTDIASYQTHNNISCVIYFFSLERFYDLISMFYHFVNINMYWSSLNYTS